MWQGFVASFRTLVWHETGLDRHAILRRTRTAEMPAGHGALSGVHSGRDHPAQPVLALPP